MGKIILPDGIRMPKKRSWDAAGNNRLTAGWLSSIENPSDELRMALPTLIARSRQLSNNNEYAKRFLTAVRTNVAGPHGIKLQSKVGSSGSARANNIDRRVEAAFAEWCRAGTCTLDGKLSFAQWLGHVALTAARDGASLSAMVTGSAARNRFGFALQCLDVAQLDHNKFGREPPIFMGVEHDNAQRAIAYHIKTEEAQHMLGSQSVRTERVEASRILHAFIVDRSLLRGVPWMAPIMMRLHMVGGYQEAEVTAARISASKMGFYTRSAEASDLDPDDTDEEGRPISEVEPGMFEALPAGWDVKAFDSQHPTTAYGSFITTCLQGVAAGLGISYHALTGDLSQANYSSLREAKLVEADVWRSLQQWMVDSVCRPVFERWLEMAITTGALNVSMTEYDRIVEAAAWQPRGWAWVDPEKEMAAYEKGLALNIVTRSEILAAQGKDFEETLEQIAREQALMAEILMQETQVVESVRQLLDKVEQRHDDYRARSGDQIAELREGLTAVRAALANVTAFTEESRAKLADHAQRIADLSGGYATLSASVTEQLATVRAAVEQATAAARGAQKVADRVESKLLSVEGQTTDLVRQAQNKAPTVAVDGIRQQRSMKVDFIGAVMQRDGEDSRSFEIAFSSEEAVERWFGDEVLVHDPGSADLDFIASGRAPLLFNHDTDRIIGRVVSARIDSDRRGRAVIEMPEGDPDAEWALSKARAGTLTNVSFGYLIEKHEERTGESGRPVVRVTRWKPLEISLVSVPADTTVGLGRSRGA
jgi:lambda family phage portal protein/HK97 family phage prohead protease